LSERQRLASRRQSENFTFELDGLRFTATVSRFTDGRISELFLNNHKYGNQSDTNARDCAIILSFAAQHGADINAIRKALCRDSEGRALGPVGAALDILAADDAGKTPAESEAPR
jgi:hypothetical protein